MGESTCSQQALLRGSLLSARRHASVWMVGSYDPELNLVYWGTGVTAPLPETLRGSGRTDLLYTNSTLALDPDTGEMAWYFQLFAPRQLGPRSAVRAIIVPTEVAPSPEDVPWISPRVRQRNEDGEENRDRHAGQQAARGRPPCDHTKKADPV